MVRSTNNVWLHRFACALAFATLLLVGLGGVVTTKGVGMAVPDWPTTYGDHMFFFPPSKWMAGIFDEHSHRLWASLVGMLAAHSRFGFGCAIQRAGNVWSESQP